jgi:(p)ppGpp synthase/HD superfamily hydrolase
MGLKRMTEQELMNRLHGGAQDWEPIQQERLVAAYELAARLHEDDRHKDVPYIYHLLRVANRLQGYLEVKDPTVIISALLHDSVEDHPAKMIETLGENVQTSDPVELQAAALACIETAFSPDVAALVARVTNPPTPDQPRTYDKGLHAYAEKVESAIETVEGFLLKFSDWCDNGVGVKHDIVGQGVKHDHFRTKYGLVLPLFETRAAQPDIQAFLTPAAKQYVSRQLELGRQRLRVPVE